MSALPRRAYALVRWLVVTEIGIWRSLFFLVTRRVPGRGPGAATFPYARQLSPIIGAFIFVSAIELPVVHLLLPWETVRLAVLVLSIWGLTWMIGLLASMKVYPHLLDEHGLRIRYGTFAEISIPWDAVATVAARRGNVASGKHVHVEPGGDGAVVSVPVLNQTRIDVVLREPTAVKLPRGVEVVRELRLYADDPRGLVEQARARLALRTA